MANNMVAVHTKRIVLLSKDFGKMENALSG